MRGLSSLTRLRAAATLGLFLFFVVPAGAQSGQPRQKEKDSKADLSRLVVVGDSLSAGFQNFSLFDGDSVPGLPPGGQKRGYAALVAQQAGVSMVSPLMSFPGIPPALTLSAGQIVRAAGIGSRENPGIQAYNLSVPGFSTADALARPFPGNPFSNAIDALSDTILAAPGTIPGCGPFPVAGQLYVSEVLCAAALKPTTVLVSIGNNDALQSLTLGLPPTSSSDFAAQYTALLTALAGTGARIVVSNIPDVSAVPYLVPVPAFQAICGFTPAGAGPTDFAVVDITSPTASNFGLCTNYAVRPAALIAQAQAAVSQYNQIISSQASHLGATVVDFNSLFKTIAQNGYTVGGKHLTVAFLGGLFSLDGIHPTNTGYAILANETIKTMNQKLNTLIPPVSVEQVASTDPLVP
jgi:lysophospholipase L1-like esterase